MSTFTVNLGPSLDDYCARLKRVAERRLTWWERLVSYLRHIDPAEAQKCLDFLPEVHHHATSTNAYGEIEVYLCYGRWCRALETLEAALTNNANYEYPLAPHDRDAATDLLARMRSA